MPISVTEFAQQIKEKYPMYKSMDDMNLTKQILEKYPVYKSQVIGFGGENAPMTQEQSETPTPTPTTKTIQEKPGFLKSLGQAILKPFAEVGTSVFNAASATKNLAQGDAQGAAAELEKSRNLPFMGETKPAFTGQEGFGEATKKMAGYGAEIGSNFIGGEGVGALAKNTVKGLVKQSVKTAVKGGALSGGLSQFGESLKNPNETALQTAVNTTVGTVAGGSLGGLISIPSTLIGYSVKKILTPIAKQAQEAIFTAVNKGIKPNFSGRTTAAMQNAYAKDAELAFHTISQFKPELANNEGIVQVRSPKTIGELLEAIGQVKGKIYTLYDALKKSAGETGAIIDTAPVVRELRAAANNPDIVLNKPEIANALKNKADIYEQKGSLTVDDAQKLIEGINTRLNSFYKNPNYNEASSAAMDALISGNIRNELDNRITSLTGSEYQPLRDRYKALKTIERDVARQVNIEARKNEKGLIDFTDILTSGDLVRGLATLNPVDIASGAFNRITKELYKKLNDPNKYIEDAFKVLEKLPKQPIPKPTQFSPAGLLGEGAIPMGPKSSVSSVSAERAQEGIFRGVNQPLLPEPKTIYGNEYKGGSLNRSGSVSQENRSVEELPWAQKNAKQIEEELYQRKRMKL